MIKYTWDDIIINPNSEQAKACIGKEVYCADTPYYCLEKANGNDVDDTFYMYRLGREGQSVASPKTLSFVRQEYSRLLENKEISKVQSTNIVALSLKKKKSLNMFHLIILKS